MKKNLLYLLLLSLAACKKDDVIEDGQAPVVLLTAPSNNQTFTAGESINITADITDNQKIIEVHLEIINNTTGAFITHEHFVPDGASYKLTRSFTAQANSAYKIRVVAEDANSNSAKAEVSVISN